MKSNRKWFRASSGGVAIAACLVFVIFVIFVILGAPIAGRAQVQPDDLITPKNADKVKDLVSPGVYQRVQNGLTMKIGETQPIELPPPYKAATETNSPKVSIGPDHTSLAGYIAGLPFPKIDANDPDAAMKVIWNMQFRPIFTDDYDLRFPDCDYGYIKQGKAGEILDTVQAGHYSGYNLVGRTEVQPTPTDPDFQSSGRDWIFGLYPVLAPAELRGSGLIRTRFAAPGKPDGVVVYTAGDRHVREIGEEMMNDPGGVGQSSPDHFGGFNAKVEEYSYKMVGQKKMLASMNAINSPQTRCPENGSPQCAERWELRNLYVIEATPKTAAAKLGGAKTMLYIDDQVWFPPYTDSYSAGGELSQTSIFWLAARDRTTQEASVAVYPFSRGFVVAAEVVDAQRGTLTKCYLPGPDSPDKEGWYINMGTIDRSFFTNEAMMRAAH